MRTRNVAVAALVVLSLVVPRAAQLPPLEPRVSNGRWSAAVNGLRGRLILTAFEAGPRQQLRIDLEIENVRDVLGPIEIPWREPPSSIVRFALEDEAGVRVVSDVVPGGNELSTMPYGLTLPHSSATRMTVSQAAYEYLPDGRVWLRPFAFVAWNMPATRTRPYLLATLEPKTPEAKDHPRPWVGPLVLPRVQLPAPEATGRP